MAVAWYNSRVASRAPDWVQRRKSARRQINIAAAILSESGGPVICQCTMIDISQGGAKLMLEDATPVPDTFLLVLSRGARTQRTCTVRWRGPGAIGVEFAQG